MFLFVVVGDSARKMLEHPCEPQRPCNYKRNAKIYEPFSMRDFVRFFTLDSRVVRGHYLGERSLFGVKKIVASGFLWASRALCIGQRSELLPSNFLTELACVIRQFVPLF